MQVILLEKVRNLGNLGDEVTVKPGYGRNFLIPKNKAVFASATSREHFEARRAELEQRAHQSLAQAEQRAAALNDVTLVIPAMASDEGKLYGSVGASEIIDALHARSLDVARREVVLPEGPIHSLGQYVVEIQVHGDVTANLQVEVVAAK